MSEHHRQDASSADTAFEPAHPEKAPVDAPEQSPTETPSPPDDAENAMEKTATGPPLDRTPSQAAKMGKKKIVIVMTALCVSQCVAHNGASYRKKRRKLIGRIPVGLVPRRSRYGMSDPTPYVVDFSNDLADDHLHCAAGYRFTIPCVRERVLMDRLILPLGKCCLYSTVGQAQ